MNIFEREKINLLCGEKNIIKLYLSVYCLYIYFALMKLSDRYKINTFFIIYVKLHNAYYYLLSDINSNLL